MGNNMEKGDIYYLVALKEWAIGKKERELDGKITIKMIKLLEIIFEC